MSETGPSPADPGGPRPSPPGARGPGSLSPARTLKRGLDIAVSATSIFLLLPLLLLVAGTIWAMDRGPPLARDTRLGCGGRPFECLRFRTTAPGPAASSGTPGDPALPPGTGPLTAIGRVLTATSLDELPRLLNVLKGEMSLVGPEPIPGAGADRPDPDLDARLSMPPGLTGPWQVEGGPGTTEAERTALDLDYARRWSLRRDFVIVLHGVAGAFLRRDRS